jgi:hypothetical protein
MSKLIGLSFYWDVCNTCKGIELLQQVLLLVLGLGSLTLLIYPWFLIVVQTLLKVLLHLICFLLECFLVSFVHLT